MIMQSKLSFRHHLSFLDKFLMHKANIGNICNALRYISYIITDYVW